MALPQRFVLLITKAQSHSINSYTHREAIQFIYPFSVALRFQRKFSAQGKITAKDSLCF